MKVFLLIVLSASLSLAANVLIDDKTGLMWQDDNPTKNTKKNWNSAINYCKNLRLNSYENWRLPSIEELEKIIDISQDNVNMKKRFKNIGDSGYYWSSSADDSSSEFAWMMNFKRGHAYNNYKTYERYIRCVRSNK